ncbi:MAG: hypothetical protein EP347_12980 [Alphaproteobacteria bacterium]|nr:MAG: hypothetical protein EP347_12980 [Alphaproteobacteria bacterium]
MFVSVEHFALAWSRKGSAGLIKLWLENDEEVALTFRDTLEFMAACEILKQDPLFYDKDKDILRTGPEEVGDFA